MKLNFDFNFKSLSGKEIKGDNASQVLANTLASLNRGNSIKLYDWALTLWNKKPLEIDTTDAQVLDEIIESSVTLTILGKHQLREVIRRSMEKSEKTKK